MNIWLSIEKWILVAVRYICTSENEEEADVASSGEERPTYLWNTLISPYIQEMKMAPQILGVSRSPDREQLHWDPAETSHKKSFHKKGFRTGALLTCGRGEGSQERKGGTLDGEGLQKRGWGNEDELIKAPWVSPCPHLHHVAWWAS